MRLRWQGLWTHSCSCSQWVAGPRFKPGAPCKFTAASMDWHGQDFTDVHCWSILEFNQWKPHLAFYFLYQQFVNCNSLWGRKNSLWKQSLMLKSGNESVLALVCPFCFGCWNWVKCTGPQEMWFKDPWMFPSPNRSSLSQDFTWTLSFLWVWNPFWFSKDFN